MALNDLTQTYAQYSFGMSPVNHVYPSKCTHES